MKVEVVPRRAWRPGVVVRAQVPFDDAMDHKTRPVVVVGVDGHEVLCHKCTSTGRRFDLKARYVEVVDLLAAGLTRAAGIELKIVRLDLSAITNVLGELGESDLANLLPTIGIPVAA
jgi:hypothetical protein